MTDAQRSYLETLYRATGEEFDCELSKADASKRIDELRERSPRLAQEQISSRTGHGEISYVAATVLGFLLLESPQTF